MKKNFEIEDMFKPNIKANGYTFCGVFDTDINEPNFVYTISATDTIGCELIAVGERIDIRALNNILIEVINQKKEISEGVFELDAMQVAVNGLKVNLKVEIKDVSDEKWIDETILNRCHNFDKVYQVYFGDTLNKLPSEEGNSDLFNQNYFKSKPHPTRKVLS